MPDDVLSNLGLAQATVATLGTVMIIGLGFLHRPSRSALLWSLAFVLAMTSTWVSVTGAILDDETVRRAGLGLMLGAPALIWSGSARVAGSPRCRGSAACRPSSRRSSSCPSSMSAPTGSRSDSRSSLRRCSPASRSPSCVARPIGSSGWPCPSRSSPRHSSPWRRHPHLRALRPRDDRRPRPAACAQWSGDAGLPRLRHGVAAVFHVGVAQWAAGGILVAPLRRHRVRPPAPRGSGPGGVLGGPHRPTG